MQVAQLCRTLCDPMDCIVHGILQARILEWVAVPFSGDLPNPVIEPRSPALQMDSLPIEPAAKPISMILRDLRNVFNYSDRGYLFYYILIILKLIYTIFT